jgi:hypothetical protein
VILHFSYWRLEVPIDFGVGFHHQRVSLVTCIVRFVGASIGERPALSEDLSSPIPAWLACSVLF